MKVNFYLTSQVKSKNKTIRCFIRESYHQLVINTNESISPDLWDKTTHRANLRKTKNKILKGDLNSLNNYLNSFEAKIKEVVRIKRATNFNISFDELAQEILKQFNTKTQDFFYIFDEFIDFKAQEVLPSMLRKYKRTRDLLKEFDKNLTFDKINLQKYFMFLLTKDFINNSAHREVKNVKTFLLWSYHNEHTKNKTYTSFKSKNEKTEIIYLTSDELDKIQSITLSDKLDRARDVFLFQCYTGVRYSDIHNISRLDIHGATWSLTTKKGKNRLEIPLSRSAVDILIKYREYPQPLPVVSNQKQNLYIKEFCKFAGIDQLIKTTRSQGHETLEKVSKKYELISTHTARRTFISLSLMKGMTAEAVMSITGHSDYKMMQKYLAIAESYKRDQYNKAWGAPLRVVK